MASSEYLKMVHLAQKQKIDLAIETQKQIKQIYKDTAKELEQQAINAKRVSLSERWALDYKKSIDQALKEHEQKLLAITKSATAKAAEIPVTTQLSFFDKISDDHNLSLSRSFRNVLSRVPTEAMDEIFNGRMYKDRLGLSERIWQDSKLLGKDIDYIVSQAITSKKSALALARDLESHVNPDAVKPWDYSKVYPSLRIKVDYNSQRLARTALNHASYLANIRCCKGNPFIEAMHWALSGSHYERQVKIWGEDICDTHTNQNDYGLGEGNFPIDKVPVPHPQCLCSQYAYIPKTMAEIGKELRDWIDGESNPEIDEWLGEKSIVKSEEKGYNSYRVIKDKNDIPDWAFKQLDFWSEEEKNALNYYTSNNYTNINQHLRGRISSDDDIKSKIDIISGAIDKAEIKENITLWRGAHLENFNESDFLLNAPIESWQDYVISDNAFSSTSILESGKLGGKMVMEILVPEGFKGAYIDPISEYKGSEYEVLLPKEQKFEIMNAHLKDNKYYVTVKLVD